MNGKTVLSRKQINVSTGEDVTSVPAPTIAGTLLITPKASMFLDHRLSKVAHMHSVADALELLARNRVEFIQATHYAYFLPVGPVLDDKLARFVNGELGTEKSRGSRRRRPE